MQRCGDDGWCWRYPLGLVREFTLKTAIKNNLQQGSSQKPGTTSNHFAPTLLEKDNVGKGTDHHLFRNVAVMMGGAGDPLGLVREFTGRKQFAVFQ